MGKKSKPKQSNKKPNRQPTTTTATTTTTSNKSQKQRHQECGKPRITLFTEAPASLQQKIQARAQRVQDAKKARPEDYTPSPIQESYPFATAKVLKNFLKHLAEKKSSSFSETVRDYLNNRVSGDNLRFQIFKNQDLKQIPGVPQDSLEILLGALNSAGDSFHFWDCCQCNERNLDPGSLIGHVERCHLKKFDDVLPDIADGTWVDEFLDPSSWIVEVALEVLGEMPEGEFNVIDLASLNLDPGIEPGTEIQVMGKMGEMKFRVVDLGSLDAAFLEKRDIRLDSVVVLLATIEEKEVLMSTHAKDLILGHTLKHMGEEKILLLGGREGPGAGGSLRFVGLSQLEKIESFLKKLLKISGNVESEAERASSFLKKLLKIPGSLERASLANDYPDVKIVEPVDEWWEFVFRETLGDESENNLVVDLQLLWETLGHESEELNVDVIVDWLYTFPPRARFKCVAIHDFEKGERARRKMAAKILDSLKHEFRYMVHYCKMKSEHMKIHAAFEKFYQTTQKEERWDVVELVTDFRKIVARKDNPGPHVDADLGVAVRGLFALLKSVIGSKDYNFSSNMDLKRATLAVRELMEVEVSLSDVKILNHHAKVEQLKPILGHACFVDYLPALVPIVQTYLRQAFEMPEEVIEEDEMPEEVIEEDETDDRSSSSESDHPSFEDEKEGDRDKESVMQDETSKLSPKEKEGDHGLKSDGGVVESNFEEPQRQVEKEAAQTIMHSNASQDDKGPGDSDCFEIQMHAEKEAAIMHSNDFRDEKGPGDCYFSETQIQAEKARTDKDSMDVGSSSAAMKAAKSQRPVNSGDEFQQGKTDFSTENQYTSPSVPNFLKTIWTRGYTQTCSTIEDFWALYDNVPHPSNMPVGTDFYCFKHGILKHGIAPMPEDEVCENGGKWILSCSRGNADTWWRVTLSALIEEQFYDMDDICGATLNVQEEQENISIWTKNGLNLDCQMRIGKQWTVLLGYEDGIKFILHVDDAKSLSSVMFSCS